MKKNFKRAKKITFRYYIDKPKLIDNKEITFLSDTKYQQQQFFTSGKKKIAYPHIYYNDTKLNINCIYHKKNQYVQNIEFAIALTDDKFPYFKQIRSYIKDYLKVPKKNYTVLLIYNNKILIDKDPIYTLDIIKDFDNFEIKKPLSALIFPSITKTITEFGIIKDGFINIYTNENFLRYVLSSEDLFKYIQKKDEELHKEVVKYDELEYNDSFPNDIEQNSILGSGLEKYVSMNYVPKEYIIIIYVIEKRQSLVIKLTDFPIKLKKFKGLIIKNKEFSELYKSENFNEEQLLLYYVNEEVFWTDDIEQGEIMQKGTFILFVEHKFDIQNPYNVLRLSLKHYLEVDFRDFYFAHDIFRRLVPDFSFELENKCVFAIEQKIKNDINEITKRRYTDPRFEILNKINKIEIIYQNLSKYGHVNQSIFIGVEVSSNKYKNIKTLIDTGSGESMISLNFVKKYGIKIKNKFQEMKFDETIDSRTIKTLGYVELKLKIPNNDGEYNIICEVIDETALTDDEEYLTLGRDIFIKYGVILDFSKDNEFKIFMRDEKKRSNIKCNAELKINSEKIVFNFDTGCSNSELTISSVKKTGLEKYIITREILISRVWGNVSLGIGEIVLDVEGREFLFEVSEDGIFNTNLIGCDYMRMNKCILDFGTKELLISQPGKYSRTKLKLF